MACLFFHFFNPTGNEYSLDLEKKCFAVVAGYVCTMASEGDFTASHPLTFFVSTDDAVHHNMLCPTFW